MAHIALFKSNETGLIEQIVVTSADEEFASEIAAADLREEFGAKVLIFSESESVEFR